MYNREAAEHIAAGDLDGIHLNEENHRKPAEALAQKIRTMGIATT